MLYQYLHTDADKDQPAEELHAQVEPFAAENPDEASDDGNHERGDADGGEREGQRVQVPVAGEGERDSHGQGVDAGGYGQGENHLQVGRVEAAFLFVPEMFTDHPDTQKGQQAEGYPVVVRFYQIAEAAGSQPPDERHQGLEKPEEEAHLQESTPPDAVEDDAAGNGHGEAIDGQTDGQ